MKWKSTLSENDKPIIYITLVSTYEGPSANLDLFHGFVRNIDNIFITFTGSTIY